MPRTIESQETVRVGDIFILDPEMDLNPSFLNVRGRVVSVGERFVRWKTIEPVDSEMTVFLVGYEENINYNRLIRSGHRSPANILGWFPKKLWADDTISDVDWSPYE